VAASGSQGGTRVRGGGQSLGGPGPRRGRQPPNTALEATGHSGRFVAGVGLYRVARASAWALGACGGEANPQDRKAPRPPHDRDRPQQREAKTDGQDKPSPRAAPRHPPWATGRGAGRGRAAAWCQLAPMGGFFYEQSHCTGDDK